MRFYTQQHRYYILSDGCNCESRAERGLVRCKPKLAGSNRRRVSARVTSAVSTLEAIRQNGHKHDARATARARSVLARCIRDEE